MRTREITAKAAEVAEAYRDLSAALECWDPDAADSERLRLTCLTAELACLFEEED